MTRMSQAGSRLLFDYLVRLGENSMLESAELDFVWLEDSLCEALVGAGRRLSNIHLSTSGTKLTDRGIVALIEGCDALKTFAMDDVEGNNTASVGSYHFYNTQCHRSSQQNSMDET